MAVIEIAKIQVRRGQENQTGVPQLAGGEFAWATDNEKLYIGLKREDGGARDANIQILTENDFRIMTNLMSAAALTADYTWEQPIAGENTDAETITSPDNTLGNKFTRSSQDKLDDFVSIADFGVVPSTTNDWTETIQNAVDHLFLDKHVLGGTTSTYDIQGILKYNKKLYFPAGIYRVGGIIFIPRNAVLVGEGIDKTIIEVTTTGSGVFQTVDFNGRRSEGTTPSNFFQGRFDATSTGSITHSITGPGRPKNIHIEGMTLKHSTSTSLNNSLSLISLDCVDNAIIRDVKFQGHNTWTAPASSPDYTGIDIRGYGALLTSENIVIDNCQFTGLYYDVKSNFDTNHIVIQNSSFTSSTYGIAFSTTTNVVATDGPTYNRMLNNKFQDIYNQGIFVGSNRTGAATFHVVENNSFVKVGDRGDTQGTSSTAGTSVIRFATPGNASVNNYFDREKFHNLKLGRPADSTSTYYPLIDGRATIDLNSVTTATATAFTSTSIMRLPITGDSQYLQLKYAAISVETVDNIQRFGTLQIYIRPGFNFSGSSPNQVKLIDEYNTSGSDGGLYWGLTADSTYKYVELFLSNPQPTAVIKLELQTKLML